MMVGKPFSVALAHGLVWIGLVGLVGPGWSTGSAAGGSETSETAQTAEAPESGSARTEQPCPFCSALAHTLTDDIRDAKVAAIAECVAVYPSPSADELPEVRFRVVDVLKGAAAVRAGERLKAYAMDPPSLGTKCLLVSYESPPEVWGTPIALSDVAIRYLGGLRGLPDKGGKRLAYFLPHLAAEDTVVADDAYNEFARASYSELGDLKGWLDRELLVSLIRDSATRPDRRRLYWTLLSICGDESDARVFDEIWEKYQRDRTFVPGLDAAIACYLTLRQEPGLQRVEQMFLRNRKAEYSDTCAAVVAIRFHGEERRDFSRARLATTLEALLDRPELADLVIPDLARWEDWDALEKLVRLFKTVGPQGMSVRTQIVSYLKVCPRPEASTALAELRTVDPAAVQRGERLFLFPVRGGGAPPVPMP